MSRPDLKIVPFAHSRGLAASEGVLKSYPDVLRVSHVAEIAGVSEQTVRAQVRKGCIPYVRMGRAILIPKARFIDYLEGR